MADDVVLGVNGLLVNSESDPESDSIWIVPLVPGKIRIHYIILIQICLAFVEKVLCWLKSLSNIKPLKCLCRASVEL